MHEYNDNGYVKRIYEMKKRLTIMFVLFLFCVSVGSVRAYTSNANFFSITEPSGWTVDDTISGAVVVFYEPTVEYGTVLINVIVQSISSSITLDELASAVKDQYPTTFDSYQILSEQTRVIKDITAYQIVAAVTTQGFDFMIRQVMLVRNLRVYVVTYAAVATEYQNHLQEFENSIETLTIIDPIPWYFMYVFFGAIITVLAIISIGLYFYKRRSRVSMISS
jgi:hypothetical protein